MEAGDDPGDEALGLDGDTGCAIDPRAARTAKRTEGAVLIFALGVLAVIRRRRSGAPCVVAPPAGK